MKTSFASQKGKSTDKEELSGKGLFLGTLAGCGKARNLLRLLNTLETNDHNRTWLQCRSLIQDYTAGTVKT